MHLTTTYPTAMGVWDSSGVCLSFVSHLLKNKAMKKRKDLQQKTYDQLLPHSVELTHL